MPDLVPILVDHSILGVIVCLLGWWIKKQNGEAAAEREALQTRLFELIEKTNKFDAGTGHQLQELRVDLNRLADRIEGKIR
tara:strand:+ start:88 stop:330 length:243 start_codon:yes stop_codon:yes gene_type:complete